MNTHASILIVDDDEMILKATRRLLEQAGFETFSAPDGEQALERVRQNLPALVLLDVNLPGMDGMEVCRRIKADPALAGTHILLLSGLHTDSDSQANGLDSGADGYITRPIPNRELLARVQAALRLHAAEASLHESLAQWSATFDAVREAVFLTDADFNILKCNRAAVELFQRPGQELLGRKCYHVVHCTEQPVPECPLRMVQRNRQPATLTFRRAEKWLEVHVDPVLDPRENFSGSVHVISDITERKQAEQALRESQALFFNAFNNNPLLMSISDLNTGTYLQVNDSFCTLSGFSREEVIGRTSIELGWIDKDERTRMMTAMKQEGRITGLELTLRRKSGKTILCRYFGDIIQTAQGSLLFSTAEDITERKQSEKDLRESEQRLASIFSTVGDILFYLTVEADGQYRFVSVNPAFCRVTGLPVDKILGSKVNAIIPEPSLTMVLGKYRQAIEEKTIVRWEEVSDYPTGQLTGEVSVAATYDEAGRATHLVGSVHDLTERKRVEAEVREALSVAEGFRKALDQVPAFIYMKDARSRYTYANRPTLELFGLCADELAGCDDSRFFPPETVKQLQEIDRRVFLGEQTEEEVDVPEANGGRRVYWEVKSPVYAEPERKTILGLLGISTDITGRKQSEERLRRSEAGLRKAQQVAHLGSWTWHIPSNQLEWSDEMYSIFGIQKESFSGDLGEVVASAIHPEDRQKVEQANVSVAEHNQPVPLEYRIVWPDGTLRWVWAEAGELIKDEAGKARSLSGIVLDITERKHAEEEIRTLNAQLEQRVEERTRQLYSAQEQLVRQEKLAVLGQLAGGVGHELRNPLGVINSAVYYLKLVQPEAGEKIKQHHAMIEQEVQNAGKIINDLLDYGRVISPDREPASVPGLVQGSLDRFPPPPTVEVALELPPGLPMVFADPRQVEQVLGNLITNACQAMKEGGRLTISAGLEKKKVTIAVQDTGEGISPENMGKIFEPLFTTKVKGIGLGLAVSKKLAEANGGRIEAKSEPGKGSTFTLYLPVEK